MIVKFTIIHVIVDGPGTSERLSLLFLLPAVSFFVLVVPFCVFHLPCSSVLSGSLSLIPRRSFDLVLSLLIMRMEISWFSWNSCYIFMEQDISCMALVLRLITSLCNLSHQIFQLTCSSWLQVVRCLLIEPFPESALNEEAGKMLMEDYEGYAKHAR